MSEPHASTASAFLIALTATLTGDYSNIVFCALIGTLWPLASAKTETRAEGAMLILRLTLTSSVCTGLIVWLIESNFHVPAQKAMGPVALMISAMGNRWNAVFDAVGSVIVKALGMLGGRS